MRQQFRGGANRRVRAGALPVVRTSGERARRDRARSRGARARPEVAHFVRWAQRIDDIKNKPEFYPDVPKRDLFKQGYISERSAHSRGSTVDLTLVRRADARELDMGSPFDFFSPKSWPSDTSVSAQAHKNRALLAAAMMRGGFRPYDKEWWHYTLADEPFPDTYFDFPVR